MDNMEACDVCGQEHKTEHCPELGFDQKCDIPCTASLAQMTIPKEFVLEADCTGVRQIVAMCRIRAKTKFGPYEAKRTTANPAVAPAGFVLRVFRTDGSYVTLDSSNENECNWLSLVQTAESEKDQNLMAMQLGSDIFYTTTRAVEAGECLKVWYAPHYATKIGKPSKPDGGKAFTYFSTTPKDGGRTHVGMSQSEYDAAPANRYDPQGAEETRPAAVTGAGTQHSSVGSTAVDQALDNAKPKKRTWPCVPCGTVFSSPRGLGKHRKDYHRKLPANDKSLQRHNAGGSMAASQQSCTTAVDSAGSAAQDCSSGGLKECVVHLLIEGPAEDRVPALSLRGMRRMSASSSSHKDAELSGSDPPSELSYGRGKRRRTVPKRLLDTDMRHHGADDNGEDPEKGATVPAEGSDKAPMQAAYERQRRNVVPGYEQELEARSRKRSRITKCDAREQCTSEDEASRMCSDAYTCDKCSVTFERRESLVLHVCPPPAAGLGKLLATARADLESCCCSDGTYACPECSVGADAAAAFRFSSAADLETHVLGHSTYFVCDVCLRFVPLEGKAEKHCERCTGPPCEPMASGDCLPAEVISKQCGSGTATCDNQAAPSVDHQSISAIPRVSFDGDNTSCGAADTPEGEQREARCAGSLGQGDAAMVHAQETSEQGRCDECDLSFASPAYLERHRLIHAGAYRCLKCGAQHPGRFALLCHLARCDRAQLAATMGCAFPAPTCKECSYPFRSSVALSVHMAAHHCEQHACRSCDIKFMSKEDFEGHTCVGPPGHQTKCGVCKKSFYSQRKLRRHMYLHTLRFTCANCSRAYSRREDFVRHTIECNAKKMIQLDGVIKCPTCSLTFKDLVSYKRHAHQHTHAYLCSKCGKRFMRQINADNHEKQCKRGAGSAKEAEPYAEAEYGGGSCGATAAGREAASDAAEATEAGSICDELHPPAPNVPEAEGLQPAAVLDGRRADDLFVCYVCGRCYISKSNLNKHIKTHGDRQFSCQACSKKFYHYHAMRLHHEAVHTTHLTCKCPHCDKEFRTKYTMISHIKQFHSEKAPTFPCPHCTKEFRQKGNLNKHLLKHEAGRNYACGYCPKTFRYPEQYRRHELVHTLGKNLACGLCERKFVLPHELRKHEREFHSNVVYVCPVCAEVCRWRHTVRRHVKRKHPAQAELIDTPEFMASLVRNASDVATAPREPLVGVDPRTPAEASGGLDPKPAGNMEASEPNPVLDISAREALQGATVHFYSEEDIELPPETAGALCRLSTDLALRNALASGSAQITINGQQFTMTMTPTGQAVLATLPEASDMVAVAGVPHLAAASGTSDLIAIAGAPQEDSQGVVNTIMETGSEVLQG